MKLTCVIKSLQMTDKCVEFCLAMQIEFNEAQPDWGKADGEASLKSLIQK